MAARKKSTKLVVVDDDDDDAIDSALIAIWDVDEVLQAYGRDRELRRMAEGQYTGIIKFLADNGMFKKKRRAVDASGKLLIRQVFDADLTTEGQAFVRLTIKPWFRSKKSAKDPTDTSILETYLAKLRA